MKDFDPLSIYDFPFYRLFFDDMINCWIVECCIINSDENPEFNEYIQGFFASPQISMFNNLPVSWQKKERREEYRFIWDNFKAFDYQVYHSRHEVIEGTVLLFLTPVLLVNPVISKQQRSKFRRC